MVASNPVVNAGSGFDRVKNILKTVTDAALSIEELLASVGIAGNLGEVERLTSAFQNLAAVAIQAAHAVSGQSITPESVLALMPANTPLMPSQPDSAGR